MSCLEQDRGVKELRCSPPRLQSLIHPNTALGHGAFRSGSKIPCVDKHSHCESRWNRLIEVFVEEKKGPGKQTPSPYLSDLGQPYALCQGRLRSSVLAGDAAKDGQLRESTTPAVVPPGQIPSSNPPYAVKSRYGLVVSVNDLSA